MPTPGATPFIKPFAAICPATLVPCPNRSSILLISPVSLDSLPFNPPFGTKFLEPGSKLFLNQDGMEKYQNQLFQRLH